MSPSLTILVLGRLLLLALSAASSSSSSPSVDLFETHSAIQINGYCIDDPSTCLAPIDDRNLTVCCPGIIQFNNNSPHGAEEEGRGEEGRGEGPFDNASCCVGGIRDLPPSCFPPYCSSTSSSSSSSLSCKTVVPITASDYYGIVYGSSMKGPCSSSTTASASGSVIATQTTVTPGSESEMSTTLHTSSGTGPASPLTTSTSDGAAAAMVTAPPPLLLQPWLVGAAAVIIGAT
ncbi:hypothetical protein M432DRAFT_588543 [Thermoascus aurantiacus ATCC 26904]